MAEGRAGGEFFSGVFGLSAGEVSAGYSLFKNSLYWKSNSYNSFFT